MTLNAVLTLGAVVRRYGAPTAAGSFAAKCAARWCRATRTLLSGGSVMPAMPTRRCGKAGGAASGDGSGGGGGGAGGAGTAAAAGDGQVGGQVGAYFDHLDSTGWEIAWKEIKLGARVASGSFGAVHVAQWMGNEVAVKIPSNRMSKQARADFLSEVRLMSSIHHPNIVLFLGACCVEPHVCAVMEYLPRGSLADLLAEPSARLELGQVAKFGIDCSRGMSYLHRRCKIIQRDLKSQNLLVDNFGNIKVCDFGLSKVASATLLSPKSKSHTRRDGDDHQRRQQQQQQQQQQLTSPPPTQRGAPQNAEHLLFEQTLTFCGTPLWSAPEVIRNEPYNERADVYSFGVVLAEMFSRTTPYAGSGKPPLEIAYHVAEFGLRPTIPPGVPPVLAQLAQRCWDNDPRARPPFEEITRLLQAAHKELKAQRLHTFTVEEMATYHKLDEKARATTAQVQHKEEVRPHSSQTCETETETETETEHCD